MRKLLTAHVPWAKLKRCDNTKSGGHVIGWHSLLDHSADVAAVLEALLGVPTIAARFSRLAGRPLDRFTVSRLAALAFLHDIGKANRGFQSRWKYGVRGAGHIKEFAWLLFDLNAGVVRDEALTALRFPAWESWFTEGSLPLFHAIFAHHGRPWKIDGGGDYSRIWTAVGADNPIASLEMMGERMLAWFPEAFVAAPPLPEAPAFHHAFAGLLMLADWLGSDTEIFPFWDGQDGDRLEFARGAATRALEWVGLSVENLRLSSRSRPNDFQSIFGFDARTLQDKVRIPQANCVVLESETGSGKTEAALWRFLHLFQAGEVDGMYFALPTRVAATQVFQRITSFADAAFGTDRPAVVLAVPGQEQVDGIRGHRLPGFDFAWDDDPDDASRRSRWAAEHPKRFLAGQIVVGTIDQALLGAIRTRHSHMRGSMLMRQLLVVDEVHASDRYMETLLSGLLRSHLQAGGHALLLSATLGAEMRARVLGTAVPARQEAERISYPALFWAEGGKVKCEAIPSDDAKTKNVTVQAHRLQDRPNQIAEMALEAARAGAKILIIRNTVAAAVATQKELEALDPSGTHLLCLSSGPTLHHSRFAPEDRGLLDRAVEERLGKDRQPGGLVVVGTQTLEISLDLDADLLITDLCPVDVLLQRIGRLHRHVRSRPAGFDTPRTMVLTPENRALLNAARRGRHGFGNIYQDMRIFEATWRLIDQQPTWVIPTMNRQLVERATHPEYLDAIEAEFLADDNIWRKKLGAVDGEWRSEIQQGQYALCDHDQPFDQLTFDADDKVATRLGAADRLVSFPSVMGPFDIQVSQLRIGHHMLLPDCSEVEVTDLVAGEAGFSFSLGDRNYKYDRFGLVISD